MYKSAARLSVGSSPPRQHGFNSRAGHHDHGNEIISIAKTICPSDDQLDLVVSSFNACVRKLMLGCGEGYVQNFL